VISVGANTFETYSDGADVNTAFGNAVDEAGWEYGHRGYTGSIAEKSEFVIITSQAMSHDDATRLARDLIEHDDPRVADKWGPAGAIPVRQATQPDRAKRPGRLAVLRLGQQLTAAGAKPIALPAPIVAATATPSVWGFSYGRRFTADAH
jgi:hypothetical protein